MKTKTINLKGKEYATVPARIAMFREGCPNGSIETTPIMQPDGSILFKAIIVKDKSDLSSATATGHALGTNKTEKDFEKLETIAVGRALAMLGFLASGEIASGEEMQEYFTEKELREQQEIEDLKEKASQIKSVEELREFYKKYRGKSVELDKHITSLSKTLK